MIMCADYKKLSVFKRDCKFERRLFLHPKNFVRQEGENNGKRIWFENLNYVTG